jgi:CheY-like chemotaxis protein
MAKILVAEDHTDIREIIRIELERMGFTAITAENGKQAVKAAIREKPDLILMDVMMPELDGWEATRILRANPETKQIAILAATALFRPSDLQACIDAGCNDYIVKPFTFDELKRKIKALIQ